MNSAEPVPEAKLTWLTPRLRKRVLFTALALALVCFAFFHWVLWPVQISGDSMYPTYRNGARHFINKLAYWSAAPQRGDVVGLRAPSGEVYIKRIVGLPGERVEFHGGRLFINDEPLPEPYIDTLMPWKYAPVRLGKQDYFLMGDNRATSILGAAARERIIGKVIF